MKSDSVKAHVIFNPTAGPRDVRRALQRVCAYLERRGWSVELRMTEKAGDGIALAYAAVQAGCDVVIAAGGDGTIGEVANGLVGTETAMGLLPVGTANVLAKQLGISTRALTKPQRLQETVAGMAEGTIRPVDVGQVLGQLDDRYFLCWAGAGLDGLASTRMEPRSRFTKRLGVLPYAIAAAIVALDFQGVKTRIVLDDSVVQSHTLLVLACNIRQYGGAFNLALDARMDDGLFDVFVFEGLGFFYTMRHLLKVFTHRHLQDPRVVYRQARRIEVQTEWSVPVQIDGDPIAATPLVLEVVPRALRLLVPPSAPSSLFTLVSQGERL